MENVRRPSTPENIRKLAEAAIKDTLPESAETYELIYSKFLDWKKSNKLDSFSENVVLSYFYHLANDKCLKPSTLWSYYSMLKSTIRSKHKINIKDYNLVFSYLKRKSDGYQPKQAEVFTEEDVSKFIRDAPDFRYLAHKVILIFGVYGCMRSEEMYNAETKDVKKHAAIFVITVPKTKTKTPRKFTMDHPRHVAIVGQYISARPSQYTGNEFFLNWQKGRSTQQRIGMNKFYAAPKLIAEFLGLPDANRYTGHAFRRTSATILCDAGAKFRDVKRHGGWKSDKVVERYRANSLRQKKKVANIISSALDSSEGNHSRNITGGYGDSSAGPSNHTNRISRPDSYEYDVPILNVVNPLPGVRSVEQSSPIKSLPVITPNPSSSRVNFTDKIHEKFPGMDRNCISPRLEIFSQTTTTVVDLNQPDFHDNDEFDTFIADYNFNDFDSEIAINSQNMNEFIICEENDVDEPTPSFSGAESPTPMSSTNGIRQPQNSLRLANCTKSFSRAENPALMSSTNVIQHPQNSLRSANCTKLFSGNKSCTPMSFTDGIQHPKGSLHLANCSNIHIHFH